MTPTNIAAASLLIAEKRAAMLPAVAAHAPAPKPAAPKPAPAAKPKAVKPPTAPKQTMLDYIINRGRR